MKYILFLLLWFTSLNSWAEVSLDSNGILREQEVVYQGHVDDSAIKKPWKKKYSEEERRNAKPILLEEVSQIEKIPFSPEGGNNNILRVFDLETREERVKPSDEINLLIYNQELKELLPSSFIPAKLYSSDKYPQIDQLIHTGDHQFDSLSTNQRILNTTADPYSRVVKLFFKAGGGLSSCSGSLVGPSLVITAAHCVHDGNFNWYSGFEVIPAYKNRNLDSLIVNNTPYRVASGVLVSSWSYGGEYGSGDDIAVIQLDRPVGSLTGWFGFGVADDCAILKNRQYTSAGYPERDTRYTHCDNFNGSQMVFFEGSFDFCSNGSAYSHTSPSCGGQSGSGYWESQRYVIRAILSGSSLFPDSTLRKGRAAIFDQENFDGVVKFYNENVLSNTIDLIPLGMRVNGFLFGDSSLSIQENEQFQELKFRVVNQSRQAFQGNIRATFYLSNNKTISTDDTSLGVFQWGLIDLPPNAASWLHLTKLPRIPLNTPAGTYYIGVIVEDANGEINTENNSMDSEDIAIIKITSAFDGEGLLGDANNDGSVNIVDVIFTINLALNNFPFNINADCKKDNKINIQDIICTINQVLN